MKSEFEANRIIEKYADTVRRICFVHLKKHSDVEDVFQEVFLKYVLHSKPFESEEHEKAWIIRVTINNCKDFLKSFYKQKVSFLEDVNLEPFYVEEENYDLLDSILRLPTKYKNAIYLHYYEGYTAGEIGKILGKNENTIYTWLSRGREKLEHSLGGVYFE